MEVALGPMFLSFLAGYVCGVSVSSAWLIRMAGAGVERGARPSIAYIAWVAIGMFNIFALSVGVVAVITFTRYHGSVGGAVPLANSLGVFSGVAFGAATFIFLLYWVDRNNANLSR